MGSMQSAPMSGEEASDNTLQRPWEELPDDVQDALGAQLEACTISIKSEGHSSSNYDVVRGADDELIYASGPHLADMPIKKIILTTEGDKEVCFLSLHFRGRVMVVETPALAQRKSSNADNKQQAPTVIPNKELVYEGATYHLTAYDGGHESFTFWGGKVCTPRWYFVKAESLGHLERELSEIANFNALPGPRKAVARLDLLQSTTSRDKVGWVRLDDFELIEEPMSSANGEPMLDGCGFISDDVLRQVLNYKTKKADMGTRLAVQVRVVAPQLGVFKGMLMRKGGIKGIQLTPSMRKVLPSASKNAESWAMVIVKQVFPTAAGKAMGNRFSPEGEFTPSRRTSQEKPLKEMVSMLLEGIGVPMGVIQAYKAKPYNEHIACVVGVADPTGELPAGTVFLTGTKLSEVFVTRYPCVKVSHGHVLSMPNTKPSSMSASAWEWLNDLKFGALIFSGKGHCPLPGICAEGDIDGDLFFICWNDEVVHHVRRHRAAATDRLIKEEMIVTAPKMKPAKGGQGGSRRMKAENGGGWLAAAQTHMTDINVLSERVTIGAKYKAWKSAVDEHGMAHPEAEECGDAFTSAIDHGKHGTDGNVSVPPQGSQTAIPNGGSKTVSKPTKAAPKGNASRKTECINHYVQSLPFSRADLESKGLQELRDIIKAHNLGVAGNVGGTKTRTKNDIIDDIVRAMKTSEE